MILNDIRNLIIIVFVIAFIINKSKIKILTNCKVFMQTDIKRTCLKNNIVVKTFVKILKNSLFRAFYQFF